MAKKTTSTAAKKYKEQQERLNQGGQNIASIAQNIVAKRQEQAVNKVGQQYGIRKTAGDMLATRALGIIQDREALSYRKRLEEEERRRREAEEARKQNVAGNLRSAAQRVNIGGMTGSPTQNKLKKSVLETIMENLGAKIENEQNIVNKQGRAEDDPARIRADKELKDLEKRRAETQEKIASIPGPQVGNAASIGMSRYTPDEEAYIRRLQGKLEKGQSKKQTIPAVWNQDLKYIQHMRNTPESTEGADYVKWLQEGADIGLYDKKTANAMIAQAGNSDDPLAQYMALTPEQKSGWLRDAGSNLNSILSMRAAKEYLQAHPYTTDRDELLAKQGYYTGLRDEAQSALDRMNGNIRIMYSPDGTEPVEIRGRSNPYYQQNPEAINELFYDALVGQGEYQKRKAEFTDDPEGWEKADELELQLAEAWDAYEQGRWNDAYRILTGKNNYAEMESQLGYANDQLSSIGSQLKRYDAYDEFMGGYAGAQRASYDPSKDRGFESLVNPATRNSRESYNDPYTKDVHRVYSFINQGKEYNAYIQNATGGDESTAKIEAVYGKAALMLPEEIEIFNGYYNAGEYKEASAFFNGLSMALNDRYSKYEEIGIREMARQYPIMSSFETLVAEQWSGALAIPRTFAGFAGEKSVYDPNSAWYASTRYTEQTQDEIANMIGGEGGKFYLQGMNTLRNMTNAAMVALAGVPASGQAAAGLAMFAAQIYQDQTFKHLKETNDYGKAVGLATLDATLETMEELLPYEAILQGGGNVFLSWLANSLSEAAEEFTGATLGDAIKGLITGRQEWEARRDQIFNEGGYTDEDGNWVNLDTGDSKKALVEAQTQAWKEKGHEIIENTVAGFVGGGLGAGYGVVREGINTRNTGVKVNSKEGGFNTLLTAARGMDENSATRKLAEELYKKQQKGKTISNYQTGKLAKTMYEESGQEIRDTIEGAMTRKVEGELKAEGASDEYAEQAAPIIAQTVTTGKNLRKADIRVIAKEDAGVILMESYMTGDRDAAESIKAAGGEAAMNAQQAVRDVLGEKPAKAKRGPATEGLREFAPIAKQSDLDRAEGPRHDNGLDAVVDGRIVSIKGRSGDNYTVVDENNEEHTVNKKDVQAADESLGLLMEYADRNRDIVDDDAFRELAVGLKNNQGMNLDDYLEQSTRAIINFRTGGTVRNSRIAAGTLNALKTVAQRQNDRWDEERIKKAGKQRKATPGKGIVTYNGIQAGTDEWETMAKKVGPILGGQLRLIGEIGVRLGNEIEIVEREDLPDAFGWEDPDTGKIFVNLAAENVKGQAGNRHVLTVTAHELTHWLEQNSPEEYKALRDFVFSTLRKNGTNIANRVIERIDNFQGLMKRDMTVNEAMAEIVADACDQVLTNEQVARQLEAESPNLYQKIKSFVKNFIETVRSYAGHIDTSKESREMIKAGQETLDELARIWLGARQEALGRQEGNQAEAEEGTDYKKSFSARMANDYDYTKTFGEQIKDSINGIMPTGDSLLVGETPKVFIDIGLPNLPVTLNQKHVGYAIKGNYPNVKYREGHVFSMEEYSKIPEKLREPVAIIQDPGSTKEIIAYIELINTTGKPVIVPFRIDTTSTVGGMRINTNKMATVFADDDGLNVLESAIRRHTKEKPTVYYLDKAKALNYPLGDDTITIVRNGLSGHISSIPEGQIVVNKRKEATDIVLENIKKALAHPHANFSMREQVEATKDGLVAVHNMYLSELMGTLEEGGVTAPSIAVILARMGHSKYGNVSLVFKPSAIDPKQSRKNMIYGADAYTPERSHARVEQEIVTPEVKKAINVVKGLLEGMDGNFVHAVDNWFNQYLYDDDTYYSLTEIAKTGYTNIGMLAAYQKSKGNNVDPVFRDVPTSRAKTENVQDYGKLIDGLFDRGLHEQFFTDYDNAESHNGFSPVELREKYAGIFKDILKETNRRWEIIKLENPGMMEKIFTSNWFNEFYDYNKKGIGDVKKFDEYETRKALQEKTNEDDLTDWLAGVIRNTLGQKGIRNNKDPFTNIGNRRSFKALHDEYTTENVVKAMYKNAQQKGEGADYFQGLMATASKEYKNLKEVKADAARLEMVDQEKYDAYIAQKSREMDELAEELSPTNPRTAREALLEAGKRYARNQTPEVVKRAFAAEGYNLTNEQLKKALDLIKEAREFKTGYFEAKPERVMGFDEIARVILPESVKEEPLYKPVLSMLDERGIPYDTYDGTDEDRLAKLNSVENVQFSIRNISEQDKAYADAVARGDIQAATDMLMEKLSHAENIIPFNAPEWYAGRHKDIAKQIKQLAVEGTLDEIRESIERMASFVPDNAVLVPMPNHHGEVNAETDTMILANVLSEMTGRPVVTALAGNDRESRFKSKENGGKGIQAEEMGFRQVQEIPEGTVPIFIDNVVGSGVTAQAARAAMGGGITLAYAKSVRSKGIPGLKRATITYDRNGNLIPLSERFNPNVKNINYSIREMDSQYMQAEKTGDAGTMERIVKQAAQAEGFDTSRFAYHGTEYFGYTEFDMPNMQNEIFVAYNPVMSATYTNRGQVKNISDRLNIPNWRNMEPEKLAEFAKDALKTMNGDPITSIKYLKHGGNSLPEPPMMQEFGVSIASSIPWYPSYMKFRRFELNALLMNKLSPNGEAEGIYRLYTRPGRQLVINARGANWNEIGLNNPELAEEIRAYYGNENAMTSAYTTRQISQYAKQAGYDSVLIEDVFDDGMKNPTVDRSEYGRIGGDIAIFFNPNDVKSADTITYDDDGNIIPPSERFSDESNDLRFSMREPELEVNRWMTGLSESSLRTEQERMLWKQYKEVNGSWELTKRFIRELTEQMRKLEAKENKTAMDTFEIQKLQGQIEKWEEKRDEYEEQILKVTSDKGYAAIMYRERNKMENLLNGRTEDEVRQTVDAMQAELDTVEKEMAARNAKLKELSERENVKLIRNQLNSAGLRRIAAKLKNDLGSELQNKEIENRLALLALKMKQGKVDSTEIMELADMLVGSMKPAYDDYVLSELRGMTIALNSSEQETLKNRGMNIRDLQRELTGTGIRVVAGGPNTIDKNWDELLVSFPQLDPAANPGDMLWGPDADHKGLMDLVEDAIRQQKAMGPDSDQVAAMVLEAASDLVPEILTDAKSMKLIRESMEFIAEINQSTEALDNMEDLFNRLRKKNANTKATLGKLENKIVDAIEYTNELAKQHDVTAWKHERRVIIDQLKDKHTKEILEIQTKYREKIAKDKKARDLMGDNNALRREIHRNISKYRRLIVNETDRENVPEAYKPLAREMLMKLIRHDLAADRKITVIDEERLADAFHFLSGMNARDGKFGLEDLNMLPEDIREEVADALANIEDGIRQYDADPKGKDIIENLKTYKDGLEQVAEAVNLITNVINKSRSISYMDRERRLDDEAARVIRDMRRIKKELAGRGSKSANAVKRSVFYGNMTPVYFFKNLKNAGISDQWEEFEAAENKNGLELTKAKAFFDKVAEDCHYKSWDLDKEFTVKFNGFPVKITTEQIMALYATWQREKMIGPEESHHLETGGVILEDSGKDKGKPRMERKQQKARKVKDGDMAAILQLLTNEQKQYVHKVVGYLSKEMSDLGNEASMRMYGIKKYNEKWYFPFKVWDGVLSARSDKGITGKDENRAAHKGWSKRRKNNAGNALVIGNFTDTAVKHVVEMINYNTFAPAIENLNKIMNYQTVEVDQNQEEERRNIRVMFQEAYGTEALRYMEDWMRDLQGGVTQDQRKTLRDRLISLFKKNAVAGSLSVTLQQPLSYIRAAMMINPKHLAGALSPQYWKGSYQEMLDHSGVAVIKQMGRFDMNFGQSAQDWIMPKAKPNAYEKISDVLTAAPQAADTMTWTRMWSAVKMEQHAAHPDMDIQSEEFLNLVGKRFNEVMRRTQVYDSTLTKSSNMRSQALSMKLITSFMAEPTLSLNVLADAVANVKEKGGKATLAKAGATYLLSAVLQAAVKGFMGAGRSPDEKKTAAENVLNKILSNLLSEANPASLIPGYSDLVEVLKNGELKDDALGVLGKLKSIYTTATNIMNPDKSKGPWRDVEDTIGQFVQLFSNIPLKNLMRDARAMYNWATGSKFAQRDTSGAVLKYQAQETRMNGDNLLGVINSWLGDAGFKTSNKAYYGRMYNAMAGGNQGEADDIREYLELAKGQDESRISSGLRTAAREDASKTPAEQSQWMLDNGLLDGTSSITTQFKKGEITAEEYKTLAMAANPSLTENDVWWAVDKYTWEQENGEAHSDYYYRLGPALETNKAAEITETIQLLLEHGRTKENIKAQLTKELKPLYMEADGVGKVKIRDEMQKAYKALGLTAADADKIIKGWK